MGREVEDVDLYRIRMALLYLHSEVFNAPLWKRLKRVGRALGTEGAPRQQLVKAVAPGVELINELLGALPNVAALIAVRGGFGNCPRFGLGMAKLLGRI